MEYPNHVDIARSLEILLMLILEQRKYVMKVFVELLKSHQITIEKSILGLNAHECFFSPNFKLL